MQASVCTGRICVMDGGKKFMEHTFENVRNKLVLMPTLHSFINWTQ